MVNPFFKECWRMFKHTAEIFLWCLIVLPLTLAYLLIYATFILLRAIFVLCIVFPIKLIKTALDY